MLELLIGTDWTANRDAIFRRVCEKVNIREAGCVLIVPEMISHNMERRLCGTAGDTASRYAEVLSFSRLENRVCEYTGVGLPEVLDGGGQIVALASAARSLHSKVKAFAGMDGKTEFLEELLALIEELKQSRIRPEDISAAAEKSQGAFAQKLEDLSLLAGTYDSVCSRGKRDPGSRMEDLLFQLQSSDYGEKHIFYVDGFPDFTRAHAAVLEELIQQSDLVCISLCCDAPGSQAMGWEKPGQTAAALKAFAESCGIEVRITPVKPYLGPLAGVYPHALSGQLSHTVQDDRVRAWRAESIRQECCAVLEEISALVRGGCRYRDIAIACGDMAAYRPILSLLSQQYQIPLYLAGKEDILQKPIISTVLSAIDAATGSLDQRDVLRYLKSALSPVDVQTGDLVENYAVIWGITGKKWEKDWAFHPEGLNNTWTEENRTRLEEINSARRRLMDPLLELRQRFLSARKIADQTSALIDFLRRVDFSGRLEEMAEKMEREGKHREVQILSQLWEIFLSAVEQMEDVLGDTQWDSENFSRLLGLLLSQYNVGTIPATLDCVVTGCVADLRCMEVKHLFIMGAEEGKLPSYVQSGALLSDRERADLRKCGVQIGGTCMDKLQSEFADLYCLLCGARESLSISCIGDNSAAVFNRLAAMSGGVKTARPVLGPAMRNPSMAGAYLASYDEEEQAGNLDVLAGYRQAKDMADYCLGSLNRDSVETLYGKRLRLSASQIEQAANCKLSYFLKYGLGAKERKEITVDPTQFGTYVHAVLEKTGRKVMEQGGFHNVSLEQIREIGSAAMDEYVEENFSQLDSKRTAYLLKRNQREIIEAVDEMWRELSQSRFAPVGFEVNFDDGKQMAAISIPGGKMEALIRGFVDRVDVYEKDGKRYFRVVDYKTGPKEFDYCDVENCVGVQLLLYLFALKNSGKGLMGDNAVPGGVVYFPAGMPVIQESGKPTPEQIEKERRKKRMRSGLLLSDEDVLSAMEDSEKPERFDFGKDKNGNLKGSLASREQWEMLEEYVFDMLRQLVDQIADGSIVADPYTRGQAHNPCMYCPYDPVCHSDGAEGRRNREAVRADAFWKDVEKAVRKDG